MSEGHTPDNSLLLSLSTPKGWKAELACSRWFTHVSQPSAACQAQDREISPAKYRRSTTVLRNQPRGLRGGKQDHLLISGCGVPAA